MVTESSVNHRPPIVSSDDHHFSCASVLLQVMVFGCLPACILKQLVNVLQMTSAADAMAEVDAKEA